MMGKERQMIMTIQQQTNQMYIKLRYQKKYFSCGNTQHSKVKNEINKEIFT